MENSKSKPKASICIPSYNHAAFVRDALDSALGQNFDSFEVMVCDDFSTDGTKEIIDSYNDPRLVKIVPPEHLGIGQNWNYCVSHAHGEYINILSSDDKLTPDYLKEQSAILDKFPSVSFATCATHKIDRAGNIVGIYKSIFSSKLIPSREAYLWYLDGPKNTFVSGFFRKSLYDKVGGFNEKFIICLDWDFWMKLIRLGDVYYNDNPLAFYRAIGGNPYYLTQEKEKTMVFENSVTNCPPEIKKDVISVYKKAEYKMARGLVENAVNVRKTNPEESKEILLLAKQFGSNWRIKMMIFLARTFPGAMVISIAAKLKEKIKMAIKRLIWGLA